MKLKDQLDIIMLKYQYEILNSMDEIDDLCLRIIGDLITQDYGDSMVMYDSRNKFVEIAIFNEDEGIEESHTYPVNINFEVKSDDNEETSD